MAIENDKTLKNIRALREFRLNGKVIKKNQVIAKSDFQNTGDFMNLCAMTPPRAEQTSDPVGLPKTSALPKTK